ncbi:hypothetical protein ES703_65896 [subsurface metagenome]
MGQVLGRGDLSQTSAFAETYPKVRQGCWYTLKVALHCKPRIHHNIYEPLHYPQNPGRISEATMERIFHQIWGYRGQILQRGRYL